MEARQPVIHIYSNLTFDLVRGRHSPGGPGYYASLALGLLKIPGSIGIVSCLPRTPRGAVHPSESFAIAACRHGSTYTIFEIIEEGDRRVLKVFNTCGYCHDVFAGDIALLSPVYWEIPLHNISKIISNYDVLVVDLQGYLRMGYTHIDYHTESALNIIIHVFSRLFSVKLEKLIVVKASLEELGFKGSLELFNRRILDVLTLGRKGSVVRVGAKYYLIENTHIAEWSIGAGDAFSALLGYELWKTRNLLASAIKSTANTARVLSIFSRLFSSSTSTLIFTGYDSFGVTKPRISELSASDLYWLLKDLEED